MNWDGGMTTAGWIFMTLFWILLLVVIVWAIAQVLPSRGGSTEPKPPEETDAPETILARRLARGEIDTEEYDRLRRKLEEGRRPDKGREPAGTAAP